MFGPNRTVSRVGINGRQAQLFLAKDVANIAGLHSRVAIAGGMPALWTSAGGITGNREVDPRVGVTPSP